jgi:phage terminase large subunit
MPKMQIPKKLRRFIDTPKRFKIAIGGRGSGKSMSFADMCLMDAQTKGIKTACFREFQNSIDDSVHALLKSEIERLNLQGFEVQNNQILLNEDPVFKFRGLARNPEGVKSMHGFQRFWVEEAQTISFNSLKALTPTLREEGSEIWFSANPRSSVDAFSQRFIKPYEKQLRRDGYYEDDLHLIVLINITDNPLVPDVLKQEMESDRERMSPALFDHIWRGHFLDDIEDSIIPAEWYDAAIDAHKKLGFEPSGALIASHDPSDEGGDSKGFALRKGSVVLDVCEKVTGDSNEGMDWALKLARDAQADWFVWDCDGLGISLKRQVDQELESTKMQKHQFRGSETPDDAAVPYSGKDSKTNKDTFFNKRAQYWWKLRDRFEATFRAVTKGEYIDPDELISLSSDIPTLDQLRSEVCRIPQKRSNNGKIQIMSKIDMAKKPYELPSPNMGDALMMAMFAPKAVQQAAVKINFSGWG